MRENDLLRLPLPTDNPLEPPVEWEQLRGRCPVATVELPSGDQATYLTRYDHVKALLADPRFTRPTAEDGAARIAPEGAGGPAADGTTTLALPDRGEPHLRWRRQVGKYFTAKRMTALRPRMARIAEDLVDDMVRSGQPADLKAGLGFPCPSTSSATSSASPPWTGTASRTGPTPSSTSAATPAIRPARRTPSSPSTCPRTSRRHAPHPATT